jgi:hypothetical protein
MDMGTRRRANEKDGNMLDDENRKKGKWKGKRKQGE